MADIVPIGVDRASGEGRPVLNGDQITTPDGTILTGGKPTANAWGVESTPTMTGNRTLVDADEAVQFLDPNGANRTVTLPTLTGATPFFVFKHVGTANIITIRAADETVLAQLRSGDGVRFYHDGSTNWAAAVLDFTGGFVFGATFMYGGDKIANDYLQADFNIADTGTANAQERYHIAPVSMTLTHLSWDVQSGNDTVVSIYVNDVLQTTVNVPATSQLTGLVELATPVPVTQGQIISVQHSVDTNDARYVLLAEANGASIIRFGTQGTPVALQFLYVTGSISEGGSTTPATNQAVEVVMPTSGSITSVVVASADAQLDTSVWSVFKNGVLAQTTSAISAPIVTGSYRVGVATIPAVSFVAGDTIALRCDTANISGIYAQLVDTSRSKLSYHFGASIGASNNYINYARDATTGNTGTLSIGQRADVFGTGSPAISWRTAGSLGSELRLYKNGAEAEVFSGSTGTTSGWYQSGTSFEQGDTITVRGPTSGAPGQTHVFITFG